MDRAGDALTFTLASGEDRLDRALADRCAGRPGLSRTRLKTLILDGHVSVDGVASRDPKAKPPAGSTVAIDVPPPVPAEPAGEAIPLCIVFEDAHLLVLDKPAGLVVHPAPGHGAGTLVNALIAHCGDGLSGIGGVLRPGIVHRLDKDTSGLLAVAKSDAAHQGLAALFADHGRTGSLERRYLALVWGAPDTAAGTIDRPLGRHPRHREKMAVVREERGRHAVTHWRRLETLGPATLLECTLETGRTHQIRVHLADLGHPVVGDPVYGAGHRSKSGLLGPAAAAAVAGLGRQALHAGVLGFEHPITGQPLRLTSEPPGDMQAVLAALRR